MGTEPETPAPSIIDQVRALKYARPFVPFRVRMKSGRDYYVKDADHVYILCRDRHSPYIIVDDRDGTHELLNREIEDLLQ